MHVISVKYSFIDMLRFGHCYKQMLGGLRYAPSSVVGLIKPDLFGYSS